MKFKLIKQSLKELNADLLVVGVYKNEKKIVNDLIELNVLLNDGISQLIKTEEITGELKETTLIHTFGKITPRYLLVIGLGDEEKYNQELNKEIAALIIKKAKEYKVKKVAFVLSSNEINAFVEGALLGNYHFKGYAHEKETRHEIDEVQLIVDEVNDKYLEGIKLGTALAQGTNLARDLVNTPGNLMTPTIMAEKAVEIAERYNIDYEILDKDKMEQMGMGGLLSVARGSEEPPKMIVLKYQGKKDWEDVIGLVGKGVTFDAGGISLKPALGMELMISDMGGGAAVLGAMETVGQIKPKVNIVAVIPATENLPSGTATKPGDVITTMSGKTIEVLNTDAEGRLILADGITYAKKLGANKIIDLATLTGAVVVALGNVTTAIMSNDEIFTNEFKNAAKKAGEKVWQLPTYDEYKEQIKSKIADLKNTGGKPAGSITAALFVGTFAEDTPWIHLDIAGTAWTEKGTDLCSIGGTGVMVRSLVQLIKSYE